ncbi:abscission/NoCut checkpoint regulator [Diorhabda sublineata]|uniref:abscission/NoCut checkpoint regulator n=1 Tax=Diorhabda sublineata TaxID=1163346 RepID=UPI0024E125F3|nr:abscission/NoCut checkpoint regulator [Diorhabda sublineata]
MSCNQCSTKFNFFHKEVGCANCGLSFCSKCVKQKSKIPSKGDEEYNICKKCFLQLNSGSLKKSNRPPPDLYLRRLENLENPAAPPITVYKTDPKIESLRKGLSSADQKLLERLEKLKDDGKGPPPTEAEIRERLQKLKGENEYVEGPSKPLYTVDLRTDREKADSLLEQFMSERDIELSHQNLEDIETRVAALREKGVRPNEGTYIKNLHDSGGSEEEVDKITKKIMDEVALDEKLPAAVLSTSKATDEEDEFNDSPQLPWCVLCNNDAKYRCIDCDGDLYCSSCNKEVHKTWGDTDHHVVPFKPK